VRWAGLKTADDTCEVGGELHATAVKSESRAES
jgi:hypothetical protein